MKNKKAYYILGAVLCLIAAGFAAAALTHPELSFPWRNWVTCTIFALYAVYTVLVFCMPKFKGASLALCGMTAVQFAALALAAVFFGTRGTAHESSWYIIAALFLTAGANFTLFGLQKKKK